MVYTWFIAVIVCVCVFGLCIKTASFKSRRLTTSHLSLSPFPLLLSLTHSYAPLPSSPRSTLANATRTTNCVSYHMSSYHTCVVSAPTYHEGGRVRPKGLQKGHRQAAQGDHAERTAGREGRGAGTEHGGQALTVFAKFGTGCLPVCVQLRVGV